MKYKKGQISALLGLSSAVLITFMALVFIVIGILIFGTGLLLNFLKANILLFIGAFILIITTLLIFQTKKVDKMKITLIIVGVVLIVLNVIFTRYGLLSIVGA